MSIHLSVMQCCKTNHFHLTRNLVRLALQACHKRKNHVVRNDDDVNDDVGSNDIMIKVTERML